MPSIPVYRQQTRATGQLSQGPTAVAQNMSGAQALGEAVGQLEEAHAASWATSQIGKARLDWATQLQERKTSAAPGAPGFTGQVLKDFDKYETDSYTSAPSGLAKRFLKERLSSLRESVAGQSMTFEAAQRQANILTQSQNGIDNAAAAAQIDPSSAMTALAEQRAAIQVLGLEPDERTALEAKAVDSIATSAMVGLAQQDPDTALARLNDEKDVLATALSPAQRAQLQSKALDQKGTNLADGLLSVYAASGPEAAAKGLEALKGAVPTQVYDDVQQKLQTGAGRVREQAQINHADELKSVYTDIAGENVSRGTLNTIDDLWKVGALTPVERASLDGRVADVYATQAKKAAEAGVARQAVINSISTGFPLDPDNEKHRKALSALFTEDTKTLEAGSPQWQAIAASLASRTRMLPEPATQWAEAALRSPDPKVAANAAQFLSGVQTSAKDALIGLNKDSKARADVVSTYLGVGVSPEEAVKRADAVMSVDDRVKELRKQQYTKLTGVNQTPPATALKSLIGNDDDWSAGKNPVPSPYTGMMEADFDSLSRDYYQLTNDLPKAQALAFKDLKRSYGVTEVNGIKTLEMMPLERFGVTRERLLPELTDALKANPQASGATAEDLIVVPTKATIQAGQNLFDGTPVRPQYLIIDGKTGQPAYGKNGLLTYVPPTNAELSTQLEAEKAAAKAKADKVIKDAAKERDLLRSLDWESQILEGPAL